VRKKWEPETVVIIPKLISQRELKARVARVSEILYSFFRARQLDSAKNDSKLLSTSGDLETCGLSTSALTGGSVNENTKEA
jgi:hypothetical protein